ncbi:hypothetical protein NXS19_002802 [Fusarium pseudograminearum]|nr:hypothetical protein NXS19_002802 [Fusarium pseudograminearum]
MNVGRAKAMCIMLLLASACCLGMHRLELSNVCFRNWYQQQCLLTTWSIFLGDVRVVSKGRMAGSKIIFHSHYDAQVKYGTNTTGEPPQFPVSVETNAKCGRAGCLVYHELSNVLPTQVHNLQRRRAGDGSEAALFLEYRHRKT